ncbi:CinA family protein [Comamonas sp. MYb396]|uniref:CinA family protein n=1 Tax=Comamonas sp. MYb396 TaxID=2745302 RepID=UPI003096AD3D
MNATAALLTKDGLPIPETVAQLAQHLSHRGWMMATAESCTGGLIAGACTERPGSSQWLDCGFVTYSNRAKSAMLDVPAALIAAHGAVSEPVARAMAQGAIAQSQAQVSVAVTGVAGPDGGSASKPVGTVWFGWQVAGQLHSEVQRFDGDRHAVRQATVQHALRRLLALVQAITNP